MTFTEHDLGLGDMSDLFMLRLRNLFRGSGTPVNFSIAKIGNATLIDPNEGQMVYSDAWLDGSDLVLVQVVYYTGMKNGSMIQGTVDQLKESLLRKV
jgi:hypothetical protein